MADVQGLQELQQAIAGLTRQLQDQLPQIALAGAQIVEAEIASRAPRDTGALIASLEAKSTRRSNSASATVPIAESARGGVEHYAIFQEFGTSKMPAHPFFRPGVEAARAKVEQQLTQDILKVIKP